MLHAFWTKKHYCRLPHEPPNQLSKSLERITKEKMGQRPYLFLIHKNYSSFGNLGGRPKRPLKNLFHI